MIIEMGEKGREGGREGEGRGREGGGRGKGTRRQMEIEREKESREPLR